ncbi:MAG: response regulator, partial [Gemmatimonadales bacterium]
MYAFLEVADTGGGMDSDTLQRIFDPFFSTKYAGRGLGLAAVMGIVDGHHGRIRIRTAVGEGTRFRIYLPTVTAAAEAENRPVKSSNWRGSGLVLVVDDEDSVRDLAQRMLRSLGFQTLAATNGREALGIMARRAGEVAVVLIDLSMPRISGPETVRRLREIRPDLPVILMSGYAESSAIPRLSGADPQVTAFLQKPFLPDDLATALRSVLERETPASPTSVGADR